MSDPLRASIHVAAAPERVFEFFTDPAKLVRWMGEHARLDATAGGEFAVDVRGAPVRGRFLELEPPRRLVLSWGYAGSDSLPPGASRVEVTFTPDEDGTRVTLEHHDLPADVAPGHAAGWPHYLARLATAAPGGEPGADPGHPASAA